MCLNLVYVKTGRYASWLRTLQYPPMLSRDNCLFCADQVLYSRALPWQSCIVAEKLVRAGALTAQGGPRPVGVSVIPAFSCNMVLFPASITLDILISSGWCWIFRHALRHFSKQLRLLLEELLGPLGCCVSILTACARRT